jgi:multidrug efflux pump subunit AcrA (membrane-fusion protein)
LEKLLDIVPGWNGYQDRQTRRKADQVLRQQLASKLAQQRARLEEAQKELISHKRLDLVDDVGSAVTQLQTFADRVRLATYGYAGVFDAVKVKQAELEQMYNFDLALFEYVDRLDAANDRLREAIPSGEGLEAVVRVIRDIVAEANRTFDEREHVMLGSQ